MGERLSIAHAIDKAADNGVCRLLLILWPEYVLVQRINGGGGRIRTFEGYADRFTVCSLWPLGNPTK